MSDHFETSRKARRDFLQRAGRFALYTPPTIMLLMHPSSEAIASGSQGTQGDDNSGDDNNIQ
jgi:formiminotetrahydrofolate cyclodeaminase